MDSLRDSVEKSVAMKVFKNAKDAAHAHIFKSAPVRIPMSEFASVGNFDPARLQDSAVKAYPLDNRPRGYSDISSVKHNQKLIQNQRDLAPIWMIQKNNEYMLLDGAHRIVASYIERQQHVEAYVIFL